MLDLIGRAFEIYPPASTATQALAPLISALGDVKFSGTIGNNNSGQITSDFDTRIVDALCSGGAQPTQLHLSPSIAKEYDGAFSFNGRKFVVEVEKANKEKILYDLLKSHMYLTDADVAVLVLPRNYAHAGGEWDLFDCGVKRYAQCLEFGLGQPEKFDRIALLGYQQFTADGRRLSRTWRNGLR